MFKNFDYGIADNNKYFYLWAKGIHAIDIDKLGNICVMFYVQDIY